MFLYPIIISSHRSIVTSAVSIAAALRVARARRPPSRPTAASVPVASVRETKARAVTA